MAQNGSKLEVEAEVMAVLMALNQIARTVISNVFPGGSKNSFSRTFLGQENVFADSKYFFVFYYHTDSSITTWFTCSNQPIITIQVLKFE